MTATERPYIGLLQAASALVVGVALTAFGVHAVQQDIDAEAQQRFMHQVSHVQRDLTQSLMRPAHALAGALALPTSGATKSGSPFDAYVRSSRLDHQFRGALGFGRAQVQGSALRVSEFTPVDGGPRPQALVARLGAGTDLAADPALDETADRAARTGEPALSGPIDLDGAGTVGFVLFVPHYRQGPELQTPVQRLRALEGVAFAPISAHQALDNAAIAGDEDVAVNWLTGDGGASARRIAVTERVDPRPGVFSPGRRADAPFQHAADVPMVAGGQSFTLRVHSTPRYEARTASSVPSMVGLAGGLLTAAAVAMIWVSGRTRRRAVALAASMTSELALMSLVAQSTSNSVFITDNRRRITWVNAGFTRATGFTAAQAIGKTPGELFNTSGTDMDEARRLEAAAASGLPFRTQLLSRREDGHHVWFDIEVQPLRDADGRRIGFMQIESDVTATHEAAEALSRERARLSSIVEGTLAGTVEWNVVTGEMSVNDRFADMLGHTLADIPLRTIADFARRCHRDDRRAAISEMRRHLNGTTPFYRREIRMRHRLGHWIWVDGRMRVSQRQADGQPLWLAGTHMDMTERRAEEQLWQARAELSGDWFWQTDWQHRFIDMSSEVESRMNFAAGLLIGLRRDEVSWFDPPEGGWETLHDLLDCHLPIKGVVYRSRYNPEEDRWLEIDGRPRYGPDGSFLGYEGVGRDVTERVRSSQAVQQSLALIDTLFQALPIPTFMKDLDGRYVRVNKAYADLLGCSVEALVGRTAADVTDEASAQRHAEEDRRIVASRSQCRYEVQQRLATGQVVDSLMQKAAVVAADGTVTGLVGTVIDVSEQRRAARATLEAKEAAEMANQAKSAFLATMSHEIRTPMNGVIGMAEILSHTPLDGEQADAVRTIRESAAALLLLIDDILDFSKIEASRLELERLPVSMADLAESVCDALVPVAQSRQVDLGLFVSPRLPAMAWSDPTRLRQVLNNLIGNAIKFSSGAAGDGGCVRVRVEPHPDLPGRVRFSVQDNGIGMNAQTLQSLFRPFTQAEHSTTRRFGGTGLGLAITRRLVDLLGGEVSVESELGQGSTFSVTLPVEELPDAGEAPAAPLAGIDCVVVDGGGVDGNDLGETLEHGGARVTVVLDDRDVKAAVTTMNSPVVLVHALSGDDAHALQSLHERYGDSPRLRHLLIRRGRRASARVMAPNVAVLDLLRRQPLLQAVAMLAGRAAPEAPPTPALATRPASSVAGSIEDALAAGRLILVAEDDPINRKVILRQLALLGHVAETAENGRIALEMWRQRRYALLLTDLHMPELDGYELTRSIRREETGGARMPVLALTANALKGEEMRALAAGMDEYLTKPIRLPDLQAAIERWIRAPAAAEEAAAAPETPAAAGAATAPAPLRDGEPVLDLTVLHGLVGDDPETVREFLSEYRTSAVALARELRASFRSGDHKVVAAVAHKLKSSSRSIGALALGELCARLERPGASVDRDDLAASLAQLEAGLIDLDARIEESLGALEA